MKGKLVLITGASSGIGAATARKFASAGARVLLLARSADKLNKLVEEIRAAGNEAEAFPVDLRDPQAVQQTVREIKAQHGCPDVLINNAGAGRWLFIEETEYDEAAEMMAVPYLAAFYVTRAFIEDMLARNSGHIVNMTSMAAFTPFPGATAYIAARKAMVGFHEALTMDLRETNIKTSLAYFAKITSTYWEHNTGSEERVPTIQKLVPILTPEQAAEAILQGVIRGARIIRAPSILGFFEFLARVAPGLVGWLMYKTGYRRDIRT